MGGEEERVAKVELSRDTGGKRGCGTTSGGVGGRKAQCRVGALRRVEKRWNDKQDLDVHCTLFIFTD